MLRICFSDGDTGQRWTLCGRLTGPWVNELRSCWQYARRNAPLSGAVVDLSDVTFIDESGEKLLAEMRDTGVEFVAAGVETKDLIENLNGEGKKPVRRRV